MKYVWDTDICIYWLKGYEQIKEKVKEVGEDSINITIITLAELKFGAYNSQKVKENLEVIKKFLSKMKVLNLDENSVDKYGEIKTKLRRSGELIEDFDILIASIAIVNNAILVTNNVDHFKRIEELRIENWL